MNMYEKGVVNEEVRAQATALNDSGYSQCVGKDAMHVRRYLQCGPSHLISYTSIKLQARRLVCLCFCKGTV